MKLFRANEYGTKEFSGILTGREGNTITVETENGTVNFEASAASTVRLCDERICLIEKEKKLGGTRKMAAANNEFFEALSMLEHERGITAEYLIEKIKAAIVIAVKKNYESRTTM